MILDKQKLQDIYATIKDFNTIMIFPHKRPDGDAIGTSYGLKDIIMTTWPKKEVHVVGESTEFTSFIGIPEQLDDEAFDGALAIALDTANKNRLGDQGFTRCDKVIKIDHHIKVEEYGDIDYPMVAAKELVKKHPKLLKFLLPSF